MGKYRLCRSTNHVCVDQLAAPQHVHPQPYESGKSSLRLLWQVVFQHALEGVQLGKHGEEEGVEIAGYGAAVLGAHHVDVRVVGGDDAREGLLLDAQQVDSLLCVSGGEWGSERISDVLFCYVVYVLFGQTLGDVLDLDRQYLETAS
jgi:hypothetical protein